MTLAKIKQYSTKEEDTRNIVWSLKRPLLNALRKITSTVQQRNSKSVEKQPVSGSKGPEKREKIQGKDPGLMVVGRNLHILSQKKKCKAGYNNDARLYYAFLENLSCLKLNLFMMKYVATMKS